MYPEIVPGIAPDSVAHARELAEAEVVAPEIATHTYTSKTHQARGKVMLFRDGSAGRRGGPTEKYCQNAVMHSIVCVSCAICHQ